ncbi:MAG: preprotein translocase subunit SecG [Coriobacteriia bacterium]|nr:preprotein translocase subunit SecG [Coriobacteriia bacterium]MCL2750521.1 preprotein translocase subunit SecG [Coriobacteriia bacterium]
MSALLVIVLIFWLLSALVMVGSILMHSSKGTGLSDIIAGQVYSNISGTSIIEKNLDRITIASAVIFMICVLVLVLIYPQGSIG